MDFYKHLQWACGSSQDGEAKPHSPLMIGCSWSRSSLHMPCSLPVASVLTCPEQLTRGDSDVCSGHRWRRWTTCLNIDRVRAGHIHEGKSLIVALEEAQKLMPTNQSLSTVLLLPTLSPSRWLRYPYFFSIGEFLTHQGSRGGP